MKKMKVTKKPKKVKINWEKSIVEVERACYECPTCHTLFRENATFDKKITRFKCDICDQELIVE
jgi:hypothetical protein